MAVVAMPAGAVFTKRAWTPPAQNQVNRSGWTGARKVLRLPGAALWKVTAAVKPMSRQVEVWPWRAFLAVLEGQANTFLMPACTNQYVVPGTGANPVIVANGATVQGGNTVRIGGLGAAGRKMYGGQYLSFKLPNGKTQFFVLVLDLVADANGEAVATLRGALRAVPAAGAAVELRNPVCEMAMTNSDVPWDENEGVYTVSFDAEEAF